jgi:antitoxin component YwqK of YwqJK toxin-antitoxin module
MIRPLKIFLLTILATTNAFSQCNYYLDAIRRPPLHQDTTKTIVINSEKYFVYSDTNRTSITKLDISDTSLFDGNWILLSHNDPQKIILQITYKNKLIDGKVICKQSDGQLLEEWNYNNGKLDGVQIRYFKDEQIDHIENYKNGLKEGVHKSFYRNGSIQSISKYSMGKKIGEYKSWHKNGTLRRIENYNSFGQLEGEICEWDEKGRLTEFSMFKDNLPVGISFGFWDGKPTFQKYFENGKLKRWVYEFCTTPQDNFETTRKKKEARYDFTKTEINFREEAIWNDTIITVRKYYSSGQLLSEEQIFFAGQKDCKDIYKKTGTHRFWTEEGKLEKELTYKDDKLVDK